MRLVRIDLSGSKHARLALAAVRGVDPRPGVAERLLRDAGARRVEDVPAERLSKLISDSVLLVLLAGERRH